MVEFNTALPICISQQETNSHRPGLKLFMVKLELQKKLGKKDITSGPGEKGFTSESRSHPMQNQ